MPVRSLRDGTIKIYDGGSNVVTVDLEDGDFSWSEKRPINVVMDRGAISHARKANEEYSDVSFSAKLQTLSTHAATTVYDALTKTGGAAAWVSAAPAGSAYAVKLEFSTLDPDTGTAADDLIYFSPMWIENIDMSEGEESGVLSFSGRGQKKTALAAWVKTYYALGEASGTREDTKGDYDITTLINTPGNTTGIIGDALALTGTEYIYRDNADTANLFSGKAKHSINLWFNKTNATGYFRLIGFGAHNYAVELNGMVLSAITANTARQGPTSNPVHSTTYMLSVTYDGSLADGSKWKFYLNGSLVSSGSTNTPHPSTLPTATGNRLVIGSDHNGYSPGVGWVDEGSIFPDYVLTAADITALYNGGAGLALANF